MDATISGILNCLSHRRDAYVIETHRIKLPCRDPGPHRYIYIWSETLYVLSELRSMLPNVWTSLVLTASACMVILYMH